ncbi:cytochrome P450 [Wilcoxina mikolae CBS 423.85]|nr:cytochrome P450 [Wilcoxina mikolae CBS 423.85]
MPLLSASIDVLKPSLIFSFAAFLLASYIIREVVYRLFLSPISHFPGPRLAGLTYWYEFFYDVIAYPEYTFKIRHLHEKYGPIIRINPDEIHISSPDFYDQVYASTKRKRDKWDWIVKSFGVDESLISTLSHDHHRIRRASLAPFFSKASVRALQPLLEKELEVLLGRFREFETKKEPLTLNVAFAAFTNDVVMQYAFGWSNHRLSSPDFDPSFQDALLAGGKAGHVLKHFPILLRLLRSLPDSLVSQLSPMWGLYAKMQTSIKAQVADIIGAHSTMAFDKTRRTIFHEILDDNKLSDYDKSTERLWQEGEVVIAAGTITTAWAMNVAAYHVLSDPQILRSLKRELEVAIPDPKGKMDLVALEQLPYLTGVVQEGVRLSHAVTDRLQRICPDETLVFNDGKKDWHIPPGTPVKRWIENPGLTRYLVAFGKGGRVCLGMNLAYAELYLALAAVFRVYGSKEVQGKDDVGVLELWETTSRDVGVMESDLETPQMPGGSKGIRIMNYMYDFK